MHIFVIFTLFYNLIFSNQVAAASYLPENPEEISWHISAMTVTFDQKKELYIAEDNVVITGGQTRLEADYVEFSNKTKDTFARGNVLLISGEDSISCNAMTLNLITGASPILSWFPHLMVKIFRQEFIVRKKIKRMVPQ